MPKPNSTSPVGLQVETSICAVVVWGGVAFGMVRNVCVRVFTFCAAGGHVGRVVFGVVRCLCVSNDEIACASDLNVEFRSKEASYKNLSKERTPNDFGSKCSHVYELVSQDHL